ncbi:glycine oxidase ThiO [Couchioplanes caeruleus]|uniref:glycine oxidase n=2 Tax=Couchioplanes caeruleus TaxID=56438 RepID=A0A1K0FCM7_9ACTN|nr:glycine oxidase ThiO [Couchioplanes caeruleus]OJF10599.1 glycine oxidase ThiO [Couchioplanes caeruleus subsp. caeruleus]ROP30226.1 glycine oxidase [Couchioplanes caeruleus]
MTDLTVIGGGIVGLAVAWRCRQRGMRVTVYDGGADDAAWYAAAGMLAPAGETSFGQEALTALMVESSTRWPGFAAELQRETGIDVGIDTRGTLAVALTGDDLAEARRLWAYREEHGLAVHRLPPSAVREREPALSPRLRGGAHIPDDRQVDPRRVVAALRTALGAAVVPHRTAEIPPGPVVVAAGLGTAALTGLPVRPVKGLVLRLSGEPGLLRHVVVGHVDGRHVYLVPRADGEIVIGATQEERADSSVTAGAVLDLLRPATELVPDLAECELTETVVRHRPATPDNAPVLGRLSGDIVVAAGHHRNGVLLTPVTADLIADLVVTGRPDPLLEAFTPGRFA